MKNANTKRRCTKLIWPLRQATKTASIAGLILFCAGCQSPKIVVIPADKKMTRMEAGLIYAFEIPCYHVPDARMQEILQQLEAKAAE